MAEETFRYPIFHNAAELSIMETMNTPDEDVLSEAKGDPPSNDAFEPGRTPGVRRWLAGDDAGIESKADSNWITLSCS